MSAREMRDGWSARGVKGRIESKRGKKTSRVRVNSASAKPIGLFTARERDESAHSLFLEELVVSGTGWISFDASSEIRG